MSDDFVCGTPPSGRRKNTRTPEEIRSARALLEAKTRQFVKDMPANLALKRHLKSREYLYEKFEKESQTWFWSWVGMLFWCESIAIGTAVFAVPDPFFIVGASALNFFVLAPFMATVYTTVVKLLK